MPSKKKQSPIHLLSWPPLLSGLLVRRYKRFLADIRLDDGRDITAHCPNSGAMTTCCEPGRKVYVSVHDDPRRKLKYTWELIDMGTGLVGVNTAVPNRLAAAAVTAGRIPALRGYHSLKREASVGPGARLDILLTYENKAPCYVEVKNCTWVEGGTAYFPDAVTARGRKHLEVMMGLISSGHRCVMLYLIQRTDAKRFAPADQVDPAYGRALREAVEKGVEILAYDVRLDLSGIGIHRRLTVRLGPQ